MVKTKKQNTWGPFLESLKNWWAQYAVSVYIKEWGFNSFASNMIKLSVNESKWSSLTPRTHALILYISIWIFDFKPEKLPGRSRNWPLVPVVQKVDKTIHWKMHLPLYNAYPRDSYLSGG